MGSIPTGVTYFLSLKVMTKCMYLHNGPQTEKKDDDVIIKVWNIKEKVGEYAMKDF